MRSTGSRHSRWPRDSRTDAAKSPPALIADEGRGSREHPAIKQDPSLQGWSWTDGTFSWVEPTAWCMLAVKKLAATAQPAARALDEAERVLSIAPAGGGWNSGNSEVYGQELPPHVPPTALGVLALQDRQDRRRAAGHRFSAAAGAA